MKEIDFNLLAEDVNFPVVADSYGAYIFDSDNNMIAMFTTNNSEVHQHVVSAINWLNENRDAPLKENPKVTLVGGEFFSNNGIPFMIVRGWGRLQYKPTPETRQDNIGSFILKALNSYIPLTK